jgi:hypothetical protein
MSADDTTNLRLTSLEEWRKEQITCTKEFRDSLHRIEMLLQRNSDKACPIPGHCLVLEAEQKSKWANDKARFEALEENYEKLQEHVDLLRQTMHRGMGALGVLIALGTLAGPYLVGFLRHLVMQ